MKAGDVKKFYERVIASDNRAAANPHDYGVNDKFVLDAINAYQRCEPPEHIEALVTGFIMTEELTVHRRRAVLEMTRDVLKGLSKERVTVEDRERLRELLKAYFI